MDGGHVRRSPLGHHHVLSDLDAHLAERFDPGLGGSCGGRGSRSGGSCRSGSRRGGRGLCHVVLDVLLSDPSTGSSTLDLAQVEVVLARHLAHKGREGPGRLCRWSGGRGRGNLYGGWCGLRLRRRRGRLRLLDGRFLRLCGRGLLCRRGFLCGRSFLCGGSRGSAAAFLNPRDHGVDPDGLALFHQHLGESPGGR
jgi:hypothetical protein